VAFAQMVPLFRFEFKDDPKLTLAKTEKSFFVSRKLSRLPSIVAIKLFQKVKEQIDN